MPELKDYVKRLVRGSTTILVAIIVASFVWFILRVFLTHSFDVDEYGLFYAVVALVSILTIFRDFGLNLALAKFIPEFMVKKQFGKVKSSMATVVLLQGLFALPITLVLFIFSDQISLLWRPLDASITVKFLALWFFAMIFLYVFRSAFQGFQDMTMYGMMDILYASVTFFLVFLLVHIFNLGIEGVALAYLICGSMLVVPCLVILGKKYPQVLKQKIRIEKPLIKKMLIFALPLFIATIGGLILGYTDTIMISVLRDTTQVGYYQAAIPLVLLLFCFPTALGTVFLPITSELWARGEKRLLGQASHFLVKFSFMLILPAVFIFVAFPSIVLGLIFPPEYLAAAAALQILSVAMIGSVLFMILYTLAIGIGKPIITAKAVGAMVCINIILNLLLIPRYGIVGAALATLISGFGGFLFLLYLVRKFVKFALPPSPLFKMIIAGLLTLLLIFGLKSIVVLPLPWLEALIVLIPSLVFYAVLVIAMGTISKQDLILLKGAMPIPKRLVKIMERFVK